MFKEEKTMRERRNKSAQPTTTDGPLRTRRVWRDGVFFILGIGIALLAGSILWQRSSRAHRPSTPPNQARTQPEPPWGQIECTTIYLKRPDFTFTRNEKSPPPTQWLFEDCTASNLLELFMASDLTPEQTRSLTNRASWTKAGHGWQVSPPDDTVISLSPMARLRLYDILRKNPQNVPYYLPYQIQAGRFDGWLADTGLPAATKELIRKLSYRRNGAVLLSDFQVIEPHCTQEERKLLAKAASETPSLLMKLRVTPDSDVAALARYWGRGGRMKAMQPLLDSLAHVPGGPSISVSYFFPEFARMGLYTYPDPETDPTALRADCFWTAMNFMNEHGDTKFMDTATLRKSINTDFVLVQTNRAFGDLILLLAQGETAIHMCVYVADDVVFSKNGVHPLEPWLLMKISDMLPRYTNDQPVQVVAMRRKGT